LSQYSTPQTLPLAPILKRFLALLIDGLLLGIPMVILIMIPLVPAIMTAVQSGAQPDPAMIQAAMGTTAIVFLLIAAVLPVLYEGLMLARNGQTLGKKWMNIRVVTPAGGKISSGQAWTRALVRIACVFILPMLLSAMCGFFACLNPLLVIGYYVIGMVTKEKTAPHDMAAKTRVITLDGGFVPPTQSLRPSPPVGRPAPPAGRPAPPPPAARPPQQMPEATVMLEFTGMLTCTSGALEGQHFEIGDGVTIGRDARVAQIVVADSRISSKHAWVGKVNGVITVRDVGSTNGTFINALGTRVTEAPLKNGDTIILADDAIRFKYLG